MYDYIVKANQLISEGRRQEAEAIFGKIRDVDTDDIRDIVERGRLAMLLGDNLFAVQSFSKAVGLYPENLSFISLLAASYINAGNKDLAVDLYRRALDLDPEHYASNLMLARCEAEDSHFKDAIPLFEKVIRLNPDDPQPYGNMIYCLSNEGRHDEALMYAEKLLSMKPSAENHIIVGRLLGEMGRTDEAITSIEKAIDIDKFSSYAYLELSTLKKFSDKNEKIIQYAKEALDQNIPPTEKSTIHFSLGKMFNDCGEWSSAFEHYRQGNLLVRRATEPAGLANRYKSAKELYTESFVQRSDLAGSASNVPVFIVGMPRSGTTLLEQVIASHPEAEGAGELPGIGNIHSQICKHDTRPDKEVIEGLTQEAMGKFAEGYLEVLTATRENAEHVVDKHPDNYTYIGLIYKLFPNAKIINLMRHPLDVCLSCYFQSFLDVPQSTDLVWIGKSYRMYREAMDHWKNLLPRDVILDVEYEQLVGDFESESHRVIDFCGLVWDDSCLEFYKTKRTIRTASVWQARQPVYSSSKKRWVNYAKHLGPLVDQVSDYLSEEDIAELKKHGVKVKKKWGFGLLKSARS